jgi:membrane protein implicated in regulation of membrane protease activity
VLERAAVFRAFSRSYELVRGHFWSVFGVLVLTVLVLILVGFVFSIVSSAFDSGVVDLIVDVASQTITAPFVALAWTMTYYRLRGLKEPTAPEVAA